MLKPRVMLALLVVFSALSVGFSDEPRLFKDPNPHVRAEEKVIAVTGGGEALDAASTPRLKKLLQKRTLDVEHKDGVRGKALFSALATDYKKKYGEGLPIFISEDLLVLFDAREKEEAPAAVPDLQKSVPKPAPGFAMKRGILHAVPIIDVIRYYSNGLDCAFDVRDGMILLRPRK